MSSPFSSAALAPKDPIFGINEQFAADTRDGKVNMSIGMYMDENGKVPLLQCVRAVEKMLAETPKARAYLPIDGLRVYDQNVQKLVFGVDSDAVKAGRVATVQALGGTGAIKVGADLLHKLMPGARVLVSDPTWGNHRGIFTQAGFQVGTYRYYHAARRALDFDGMLADLRAAPVGSIVILHACCHNPTGYDLNAAQWGQVIEVAKERGLTTFLDMAYQGFADGITEDGAVIGQFIAAGVNVLVSNSFSKNFSLYGERVGALSVVCTDKEEAGRVLSQLKLVVRANYSNPPTHGATIVAQVLADPKLRAQWEGELAAMRQRIKSMRQQLADGLKAAGVKQDMGFITTQVGMFSYSGLSKEQMQRLRQDHAVYGLDSGRLCVAALNPHNIAHVCKSIAAVM